MSIMFVIHRFLSPPIFIKVVQQKNESNLHDLKHTHVGVLISTSSNNIYFALYAESFWY